MKAPHIAGFSRLRACLGSLTFAQLLPAPQSDHDRLGPRRRYVATNREEPWDPASAEATDE